jgi:hypothetical protein
MQVPLLHVCPVLHVMLAHGSVMPPPTPLVAPPVALTAPPVALFAPLAAVAEPPVDTFELPPLATGPLPLDADEPPWLGPPLELTLPPAAVDLPPAPPLLEASFVSPPELQATSQSDKPAKRKRDPCFNQE